MTRVQLTQLDLVAGLPGGAGWVDGTLVAAHFSDPLPIAGDGQGHLFVGDGDVIREIDIAAGMVTTIAGAYGQFVGGDGPGLQARFNLPSGLAFDSGQLYIADTENHLLRKMDLASANVTTISGQGPGTTDGPIRDALFREPEGLALDAAGNLFIGDTDNNTVRKLTLASGTVTTLAGSPGVSGDTEGVGAAALFTKPRAVGVDGSGHLYVADTSNNRVCKVATDTGAVSTMAAFQATPQGFAMDGSDVLASLSDNTLVRIAANGTVSPLAGAAGVKGFVDGAGADARFISPAGLLNDGAGTLYVVDAGNHVIRTIALGTGTVSTFAGAKSAGGADGRGSQARFFSAQGLATDGTTIYVADTNNHVIRKIVLATGDVTTVAGATGQAGRADGPSGDARFNQPQGVALDAAAQKLYVADTANRAIRLVDLGAGTVSTPMFMAAPGSTFRGLDAPTGLALDGGRLFVTDYTNDLIVAVDLNHAEISTLAGQYRASFRADGVGMAASFYGPIGIAADGRGNLYVADNQDQSIRKIVIATATVSTLAGGGGLGRGRNDGVGADAQFFSPSGVAANGSGDLFVADTGNNTVRHIDTSSAAVTTVVGGVTPGVMLGPLPAQLSQPLAVAITPAGGVLITSENSVLIAH
jgi:sugar lactone lactonase YvrE